MNYTYTQLKNGYAVIANDGYKIKITTHNGKTKYANKMTTLSLDTIETVAESEVETE